MLADEHVVEGFVECGGCFTDEVPQEVQAGGFDSFTERKASGRRDDGFPIRLFVDGRDAGHPAVSDIEVSPPSDVVRSFVGVSLS